MFTAITCPACQHKFTVPEGAMGKRQTCPNCQSPFMAGKSSAEPEISMKLQPAAAPGYNKTMIGETEAPIKFNCPRCKKPLESPAIEAGIKKPCPECGQRLQVPAAPTPSPAAGQPNLNKTLLASDEAKPQQQPPIKYNCPNCKKPLESPAIEALTKKNCPSCGQRMQVPAATPGGAPQPNLNKTVLASDESKPQTAGIQAGQPVSAATAPSALGAPAGTVPASQTTPGSLTVSKGGLLIGGAVVAIGLIFLVLLACVITIFTGKGEREALAKAEKEIAEKKAKLEHDQEKAEKRLEDQRREDKENRREIERRQEMNALIGNKRDREAADQQLKQDREAADERSRERDRAHQREMESIRAQSAANAAAAAAASRPYYYNRGYWSGGYWYPY